MTNLDAKVFKIVDAKKVNGKTQNGCMFVSEFPCCKFIYFE